ncbi:MAG: 3-dehydroquinate synthase, partial [Bacteroidales bacterium]|nr:3-dehydroquinate synthase [Bacteroidales bacterium]
METKINIVHCPLAEVGSHIPEFSGLFIICDRNVSWIPEKIGALAEGVYTIEATEQNKTIGTVAEICRWLMEQGADRKAFLLGIGGGVTTDITGFAASVYKRGVKFGFIPTTLLSQVDAAIGGKNGVNLDSFKNMVGVIRQPESTFICPEPLETLPDTQMVSGAAELLKTFIISNDNDNYFKAVDALKSKSRDLGPLVAEAAKVKA